MLDTNPIGVVIAGCTGRMGRALVSLALEDPAFRLVGALERPGAPAVGADVGQALSLGREAGLTIVDDPIEPIAVADAVIDFTAPTATLALAELAAQARIVHVIGTTGYDDQARAALDRAAHHAVQVRAGNMSLGVSLLTALTRQVARALDESWDVEIVETHHNQKVDAPSGTALMLGEAAAEGRGVLLETQADRGRDGLTGAREKGRIGFASLRGGDVVGEHDVIFAGPGERVVLRHIATDRAIFARGALKAALWGQDRPPGVYDMIDVLGLPRL